jgi:hypothetical protein
MTVLTAANSAQELLQITKTSSLIGLTDGNALLLRAMLDKAAREIRDYWTWPQLTKEYTFPLATGQAGYALPPDMNYVHFESLWNRTQRLPLMGPLNSVAWQEYKSGIVASFPRQRYMVRGWSGNNFSIDPTPSASDNGQTLAFDYSTQYTMRPTTEWVASTSFLNIRYCYYGLNIYDRGSTGAATSGTTPPTHTSGSVSDGSISWAYVGEYDTALADSDVYLVEEKLVVDEAVWRFLRARGLDYGELKQESADQIEKAKTNLSSAEVLSFNQLRMGAPMIGIWSYPEGNF